MNIIITQHHELYTKTHVYNGRVFTYAQRIITASYMNHKHSKDTQPHQQARWWGAEGLGTHICPRVRCCDLVASLLKLHNIPDRWKNKWPINIVSLECNSTATALIVPTVKTSPAAGDVVGLFVLWPGKNRACSGVNTQLFFLFSFSDPKPLICFVQLWWTKWWTFEPSLFVNHDAFDVQCRSELVYP